MNSRSRTFANIAIVAALLGGAAWVAHTAWESVVAGPSDNVRRWRTSQYILVGENPYAVSKVVLEQEVGPLSEVKLGKKRLFHIPQPKTNAKELGVFEELGAPEAVYPPPAQLLLTITNGLLRKDAVLPIWVAINLLLLAALAFVLMKMHLAIDTGRAATTLAVALAVLLLWAPAQQTFFSSQLSLLVTLALLLALWFLETRPLLASVMFTIALIKPSMAIPFLMLPLIRGKWGILAMVAGFQFAAIGIVAGIVSENPITLISQWLTVSGYFTQGPYSIQTVLNRFRLDNTSLGLVITFGFLLACLGWCWWHRRNDNLSLFSFLCLVSVLWTYHGPYDLVILIVPLLHLARRGEAWLIPLVLFVLLDLATWSPTYVGKTMFHEAVRWSGRLVLLGMFTWLGLRLMKPALRSDATGRTIAVS